MDIGRQRSKLGEHTIDGFLELIMYLEVGICHQESHSFNMSLSSPTPQKGKEANGLVLCSFLAQQKSHYIHIT